MLITMESNWLWVPPETPQVIDPPVETRRQELPLRDLPWPDFQRLCARLAQHEGNVEFVQEYGIPGQKQDGIDIYIRKRSSTEYAVWQCKRYQDATASTITCAVDEFLKGKWVSKSDEFAICITCYTESNQLADEIEKQSERLSSYNIAITPLGLTQLSDRLKAVPELVDDFFGREWVRVFCGEEAASDLGLHKLLPSQISELRSFLHHCYLQHFESVDPGLPYLTSHIARGPAPFPLMERYVPPDIIELRDRMDVITEGARFDTERASQRAVPGQSSNTGPEAKRPIGKRAVTTSQQVRRPALPWLVEEEHTVLIGDPGIGKSAFLRYVALDLLSARPRSQDLVVKWGHLLPVWVPFAMWVRLVSDSETNCSLAEVLLGWLKKVCAPSILQDLVLQALDDSRLLLLVDGLDEWTNETAAHTTLALLEQFIRNRSISAVATCRPLGFQRLGGLSSKWRRGRLAGMTRPQQAELAKRWFLHQQRSLAVDHGVSEPEIARYAGHHSRMLTEDIQRDSRLSRLAETPLLLSGMIALSAKQVQLPRSRFKAYAELTKLLLEEQPRRREKAAHSRHPSTTISAEMRQQALACLAYETHREPGSVSLDRDTAKGVLRNFFVDSYCKPRSEAHDLAQEMITVGSESVGILVEKAQDEIGFLHRTFQEFLAAYHLRRMPFSKQQEHKNLFSVQPAWQNVFLCLCFLNERVDENDQLVQDIESLDIPPEAEVVRTTLLSELAFAGLHCSPPTAMRLADAAFREIEHGSWMPLRKRLLEHALDGFHSDILHSNVASRIRTWYPARHEHRGGAFKALAEWPREDTTTETFLRGLQDEDEWSQRAAAEALSRYARGDSATRDQLLGIIAQPCDPRVLAYVLHSLCLGWPEHIKIPDMLETTRESGDSTVAVVAAYHRVQRGEANEDDKHLLLHSGDRYSDYSYFWQEDAALALAKGWPDDADIKEFALQALRDRSVYRRQLELENAFASTYLFNAYPRDDEVADIIAHLFRTEEHPGIILGFDPRWEPLIQSFAGHPHLQVAVDDWFEKQKNKTFHLDVCLISRTDRAKKTLLTLSNKPGRWGTAPIRTLVAGWGVDDPQVRELLCSLCVNSEVSPYVADLLPLVVSDRDQSRRILLTHLREQQEYDARFALEGLISLGCQEDDNEVVDAALDHWANKVPCGMSCTGVRPLIQGFAKHPKVRALALHQIRSRNGDVAAVARSYKDDADMRAQVIAALSPLPIVLRLGIVDWLERQALDDEFASDRLAEFDEDTGREVKTAAAIANARTSQARGSGKEQLLEALRESFHAVGPDLNERKQAAFAALLELQHAEVAAEECTYNGGKPLPFYLWGLGRPNMRLAHQVAAHWKHIDKTFGRSFWDRTGWIPDGVMEEIASNTSDAMLRQEILNRLLGRQGSKVSVINLLSDQLKGTEELRDKCLQLVRAFQPSAYFDTAPCIRAAEILGYQFKEDHTVREQMEDLIETASDASAAVIALCEGWPESEFLAKVDPMADKERRFLVPAYVCLMSALRPPNEFVDGMGRGLASLTGDVWDFLPICTRAIQKRFQTDAEVRNAAFNRLANNPTPAEKMVLASMLHHTDSRIERLRAWCSAELSRQLSDEHLPEYALDIRQGIVRPIAHVLLDILSPLE